MRKVMQKYKPTFVNKLLYLTMEAAILLKSYFGVYPMKYRT